MNLSKRFINLILYRRFSKEIKNVAAASKVDVKKLPPPEYDVDYLCNESNKDSIAENIKRRKGIGDIEKIHQLLRNSGSKDLLYAELCKIPNRTDPEISDYGTEARLLKTCGSKPTFNYKPKEFSELAKNLRLIRTENLGNFSGSRSYILIGDLAELEEALIYYSINTLLKKKFQLISVPDILPTAVIERCGMTIDGERTQVYNLDPIYGSEQSLSGTAEMAIAGKLAGARLPINKLPLKYAAVSRCYRAESSKIIDERGIYRVHQFTKVEMFICSEPQRSSDFLDELRSIEEELFHDLGLHFQVMDMPPPDLGAPAYRKFDIEGWMPGRKKYGELSSCSNCTDYQSRRLDIKYEIGGEKLLFDYVHTLNGTACAIPRMLIAICETYQTEEGNIKIPDKLLPYMKGKTVIEKQVLPDMRFAKYKPKLS